jgi:hypothetical protein
MIDPKRLRFGSTASGQGHMTSWEGNAMTEPLHWLKNKQIAGLQRPTVNQELLQSRYDPSCPSEWYRGYVSVLWAIRSVIQAATTKGQLIKIVDGVEDSAKLLPADDQRRLGASFATMNVAEYTKAASTVAQVINTLDLELPCIALCFSTNKQNGL